MGDVLARIKSDMGESAVIVHTRSFKRGGIFGIGAKTVYEVTANNAPPPATNSDDSRSRISAATSQRITRKRSARIKRDSGSLGSQSKQPALNKQAVAGDQTQDKEVIEIAKAFLKKRNAASRQASAAVTNTAPAIPSQKKTSPQKKPSLQPAKSTVKRSSRISTIRQSTATTNPQNEKTAETNTGLFSEVKSHKPAASRHAAAQYQSSPAHPVARRYVVDAQTGRVLKPASPKPIKMPSHQTTPQTDLGSSAATTVIKKPKQVVQQETPKATPEINIAAAVIESAEAFPPQTQASTVDNNPTVSAITPVPTEQIHQQSLKPQDSSHAAQDAAINEQLQSELTSLKQMVGQVLQRQSPASQPAMPEMLFKQYLSLIESDVAQDLADEVCSEVRDALTQEQMKNPETVRKEVVKRLAAYIPTAEEPTSKAKLPKGQPLIIALIGPTGVGKTTTIAKLAATYKLRQGLRVSLITTDTYRIAAVDQLRTYANIIGIPLKVALTPSEMTSALHTIRDTDVVLIDTAGRSPNDLNRIEEIQRFLDAANPHETHLVLSSTSSEKVLLRTIDRFDAVETDRLIFTKLDEAVSFGVIVNVMRQAGKQLSFVTTGQEVPDQIEAGQADRLARLILGEKLKDDCG